MIKYLQQVNLLLQTISIAQWFNQNKEPNQA